MSWKFPGSVLDPMSTLATICPAMSRSFARLAIIHWTSEGTSTRCNSILDEPQAVEQQAMSTNEQITLVPFQIFRAAPIHLAQCLFLVTDEWISLVKVAFNPDQMIYFESLVTTELQSKADVLLKILWSRLETFARGYKTKARARVGFGTTFGRTLVEWVQ